MTEETKAELEITTAEHHTTEFVTCGKKFLLAVQIKDCVDIVKGTPTKTAFEAISFTVESIAREAANAVGEIEHDEMVDIDWSTSVRVADPIVMRKLAAAALESVRAKGYDARHVSLRLLDDLPGSLTVIASTRCALLVSHEAIMARTVAADNLAISDAPGGVTINTVNTPPK